jgi:beta-lactamase regulating signal transducer with metallopeptidase domain
MEIYILKSGLCLAVFYGFYKLLLEKESFHVFKRFYLLFSTVLAFVIPLITFTEYIEIIPQKTTSFLPETFITSTIIKAEPINYLSLILWGIYGLGVFLFGFKFLKNLLEIIVKIKRNPKLKNKNLINVLLQDLVIPHTFFNYIFLNKQKFESHQIPKEVLLHEETHARQKHSLDVLLIELVQIFFWFNPIVYLMKRSIKLNHEFLADQSVINNGITPSTYQKILLTLSSNASENTLANSINYSSIKKRFTVMKTQTSKQAIWLRIFVILPLFVILIYGFSEKNIVEKKASETGTIQQISKGDSSTEMDPNINYQQQKATLYYNILILINHKGQLLVNDFRVEINNLKNSLNDLTKNLTNEQKKNIIVNLKCSKEAPKEVITRVNTILRELKFLKFNLGQTYIYQATPNQQIATPEEVEEYNNIIKQFNSRPEKQRIIKVKDKNRIEYIYNLMTAEQKKENEAFPDFLTVAPPPPPSPAKK